MRYILIGILIYLIYLVLKFFLGIFQNSSYRKINNQQTNSSNSKRRKIDLSDVEDADFEDINKNQN